MHYTYGRVIPRVIYIFVEKKSTDKVNQIVFSGKVKKKLVAPIFFLLLLFYWKEFVSPFSWTKNCHSFPQFKRVVSFCSDLFICAHNNLFQQFALIWSDRHTLHKQFTITQLWWSNEEYKVHSQSNRSRKRPVIITVLFLSSGNYSLSY